VSRARGCVNTSCCSVASSLAIVSLTLASMRGYESPNASGMRMSKVFTVTRVRSRSTAKIQIFIHPTYDEETGRRVCQAGQVDAKKYSQRIRRRPFRN